MLVASSVAGPGVVSPERLTAGGDVSRFGWERLVSILPQPVDAATSKTKYLARMERSLKYLVQPGCFLRMNPQHASCQAPEFRLDQWFLLATNHPLIISPPLGCRICPVKYEASSDARNTYAGASSAGSPARPIGTSVPTDATLSP